MKADTTKVGTELEVSHGRMSRSGTCLGGVAKVETANAHVFTAVCVCGWRFSAMHTAGYNAPEVA
jgi:hypothetical protein